MKQNNDGSYFKLSFILINYIHEVLIPAGLMRPLIESLSLNDRFWSDTDQFIFDNESYISNLFVASYRPEYLIDEQFCLIQDVLNRYTRDVLSERGLLNQNYKGNLEHPFYRIRHDFISRIMNAIQ